MHSNNNSVSNNLIKQNYPKLTFHSNNNVLNNLIKCVCDLLCEC